MKVISGDEIWSTQPPLNWIVTDFLPQDGLGMISASGESRKSWLLVSLGIAVASGTPWLGVFSTVKKKVLYLDYENGEYETRRRCQGLSQFPVSGFDLAPLPHNMMSDAKTFPKFAEAIAKNYGLILIDSLSAANAGMSENDSRFAEPLRRLKLEIATHHSSAVVIHHDQKDTVGKDGETIKGGYRGSTAIFNALDSQLACENLTDAGDKIRVTCRKMRMGEKPEGFEVS